MKAIPLAVAGAFHTPLMQPAVERLADGAGRRAASKSPRIPVVSNVDAQPHDDPDEIRQLLVQQVCSPGPLGRLDALPARRTGLTQFYEVGPGRVLRGLLKRIARKVPCENIAA